MRFCLLDCKVFRRVKDCPTKKLGRLFKTKLTGRSAKTASLARPHRLDPCVYLRELRGKVPQKRFCVFA